MSRALGIDYGSVRIGLALSDELGMLAHPLETLKPDKQTLPRIVEIVRTKDVDTVVIGIPKTMKGELGPAAEEAQAFAGKLRSLLPVPLIEWDERLTTVAAHRALQEAGKKTRQTRGYVDQVAAQMILQGYLDQQQMRRDESNRVE